MAGVPSWNGPRTAIVTGGGQGLGRAIALRLALEGAAVAVWDLDGANAELVAGEIRAAGARALGQQLDVSDRAAIDEAVAVVRSELGAPTILINNAGITPFHKFMDLTEAEFLRVLSVNVLGVFHCCQAVLPDMMDAHWGRIVNISSSSAQTGNARHVAYSSSKGAVITMTRSLAKEFGSKGVTVNTIPPSFVESPSLHAAADAGELGPGGIAFHEKSTPVRRVGQPEDIAAACAFLVRDDAGYITGQVLGVNGGRVIV